MENLQEKLLPQINDPADLRRLSVEQLDQLAAELREYIIQVVSVRGGHLAPNLGAVELTLALHYAFDTPTDQLVWDVGHQCYTHKIITGRREAFSTLRSVAGLSGFPKRCESPYDVIETGHASTSISAALGLAAARDIAGRDHQVVAVIGDGALTGGLAWEGLNNVGFNQTKMIVVLNDNEMSIDPNVGALAKYLLRMRTSPGYLKLKKGVKQSLPNIPLVGKPLFRALDITKDAVKSNTLNREGLLFEEMGLNYMGPVDGHDIPALIEMFSRAKEVDGPVLLHVLTHKGHGYAPAEEHPERFHGTAPFDIETGKVLHKDYSYTNAFSEAMVDMAAKDERIVGITAAMSIGTGLAAFAEQHPQRFFDVGIAEEHALTFASGLAAGGARPIVALYSSFLQRAYDQLLHDICMPQLPVVIALDRAGIVGDDGETHQGIFDISFLRSIPGLTMLAPKNAAELQAMLPYAVSLDAPVVMRYPRGKAEVGSLGEPLVYGHAELRKSGADCAIFAVGPMCAVAEKAAELLLKQGIRAAVYNARFLQPLPAELMEVAASCPRIATIEDNIVDGGFGEACRAALPNSVDVLSIGFPKAFIQQATRDQLFQRYGLTALNLAAQIQERWFNK